MNGKEMPKSESQNGTNGSHKTEYVTESPFQRSGADPKRRSRASIRQLPRRTSIASIKSRGGWGNKWGPSLSL